MAVVEAAHKRHRNRVEELGSNGRSIVAVEAVAGGRGQRVDEELAAGCWRGVMTATLAMTRIPTMGLLGSTPREPW
jgi:hypothetical protein